MDEAPLQPYLRGTTRGLDPGRDYEHFCDSIADVYVGVRPRRPDGRFDADYALYSIGDLSLGRINTPGVSADRDAVSLRTVADDAVFLNHSPSGWALEQRGRRWTAVGGEAFVLDNAAAFTVVADPSRRLRLTSVRVPHELLPARARAALPTLDDRLAGTSFGRQLGAQISLLATAVEGGMRPLAETMGTAILQMLDGFSRTDPVAPRRIDAMRAFALARLGEPSLDLRSVARTFRCSTRTVQLEFARDGASFSAWLTAERLDRARDMLRDPAHAGRPIAAIGRDHGYRDAGTFHRAYRARFGSTPGSDR